MKKYSELFTGTVVKFDPARPIADMRYQVLLKKTNKHYIDSQRVMYDINTGREVGIIAKQKDVELLPRLILRSIVLFPDTGLPGMYKLHRFTHNVQLTWKAANHRVYGKEIHVRVNKRWAVDMFGRRFNKLTGECFDDAALRIDVKSARPWEPICE